MNPETARGVADALKQRTDALREERDRRLPAPSARAAKPPPVAPPQPLEDRAAVDRADAAAADALARQRLREASEALLVDTQLASEEERERVIASLQERLLKQTSEKSAAQRQGE